MKKILLTMMAFAAMSAAMAQQDKVENKQRKAPHKPTPEAMTDRMAQELNLTDEQKAKVLELNKEYDDVLGMPGMRHGHRGMRPEGMKLEAKAEKKATVEKKAQAEKNAKAEKKEKIDAQTGATEQRPERAERPQLTEDQKAKMEQFRAKRQEYDGKLKEILTPDQYQNYQQKNMRGHRGPRPGGPRPERAPEE